MKNILIKTMVLTAVLASQTALAAGIFSGGEDVEPRFRAKIMKEKVKQNVQLANTFNFNNNGDAASSAQCGSQSIGNVDTGSRIGAAPREVFVFAPNAINLVSGQGCK